MAKPRIRACGYPEFQWKEIWILWLFLQLNMLIKQDHFNTENWTLSGFIVLVMLIRKHGEGNGNPLQCYCLENPVDRGAWWAAVHGIAQSQTRLKWFSIHASFGEGNGNPLQYSCLENPRDRGAWWAAVYGVAQSRTWLKRLSSSSSSYLRNYALSLNFIPFLIIIL